MITARADTSAPSLAGPAAIVVDWGTTSFRAFLVDAGRHIVARKKAALGLLQLRSDEFSAVLGEQLADWIAAHPDVPVLMSGMVGSRRGWREAPYVNTPATLAALARRLVQLDWDRPNPLHLVPGVDSYDAGRGYEVMRGEEVQVFGALALLGQAPEDRRRFCLPGTHSKWVDVAGETICGFRTHMTGELFELLSTHSLLASAMLGSRYDEGAFAKGVLKAARTPGSSLTNLIFSARALALNGGLAGEQVHSYLSGLLIGQEVAAEATRDTIASGPLVFVGEPDLCRHYSAASGLLDLPHVIIDAEQAGITCALALLEQRR